MSHPPLAALAALAVLVHAACSSGPGPDLDLDAGGLPIDATPDTPEPMNDPAIDGKLVINEVMAANVVTVFAGGVARDWIELHNPTDVALRLQGYGLSDDLAAPRKHLLGPSVQIPARGYLLLWADDDRALGATHLGFRLRQEGGAVVLARPDGSVLDRIEYGAQAVDFSAAREPDGSDAWVIEWHPSPGGRNPVGGGAPIGAEDVDAPPEQVPAAGDLGEQVLGYHAEPQLALTIGPTEAQSLRTDPRTYVRATVTFRGRTWGPVAVRLKGVNSFQPFDAKPSFKLDFDEFVPSGRFFDLEHLVLNNMDDDFSMMHERLAYWVARGAGIPSSRSNHLRLTVNGEAYGLYAGVEDVDRIMLRRWFADADGPLFEATDVDFAPRYVDLFELDSGPDDRSALRGLAEALTMTDPEAALAAAGAYVELAQWRRFWAVETVLAQFDAYPYSIPGDDIYVYVPPGGKLQFIPWGMDETFYSGQLDVLSPTLLHGLLATTCKASPTCFQAYVDQVWEIQALTEAMDLIGERQRVASHIAAWVAADTNKPYLDAEVATYQMNLYWFVTQRRMNLTTMLPPPSP